MIVDMTSVETGDSERDQILRSADLFDVKRWPEARFKTTSITRREGNRYLAQAELTIRDQTRQIPFPFTLEISEKTGQEGQAVFRLTAEVPLKRPKKESPHPNASIAIVGQTGAASARNKL